MKYEFSKKNQFIICLSIHQRQEHLLKSETQQPSSDSKEPVGQYQRQAKG